MDEDSDSSRSRQSRTSFFDVTVNLILAGLGAGILSLPWTLAGAGIINGVFWNFFVVALCYMTMMFVVVAAERAQVFCFEDLLEVAVDGGRGG